MQIVRTTISGYSPLKGDRYEVILAAGEVKFRSYMNYLYASFQKTILCIVSEKIYFMKSFASCELP